MPIVFSVPALAAFLLGAPQGSVSDSVPEHGRATHRVRIDWRVPQGCPSRADLEDKVAHYMGEPSIPPLVRPVQARGSVERHSGGWTLTLVLDEGGQVGRRVFEAPDCPALTDAAAVVIAVSLDPNRIAERLERVEGAEPGPEPSPDPRPPPTAIVEPSATPSLSPALEHRLQISAGVEYGLLPSVGAALLVGYAATGRLWRLEAGVLYLPPRSVNYGDGEGGRLQLAAGELRGCVNPTASRVEFPICGGVAAGPMFGRGEGVEQRERPVAAWVGATVGPGVLWRIHRVVALRIGSDAVFSLVRPGFRVDGRDTLFRVPPLAVRGLVGLEFRFR